MTEMTNDELTSFYKAIAFAGEAHHGVKPGGQRRSSSNQPYLVHVLRVAYLALDADLPADAVIAAILHDVVEDCPRYTMADIDVVFSERTAFLVDLMSKWWNESTKDKETLKPMKKAYYERILADSDAINVKLLDRVDNLRDMILMLPNEAGWARRYLKKTREEIEPLYLVSNNAAIKEVYRVTIKELESKLA